MTVQLGYGYNSYYADALKYLDNKAVVDETRSITSDIGSQMSMMPIGVGFELLPVMGDLKAAELALSGANKQIKDGFFKSLGKKIINLPSTIASIPSKIASISSKITGTASKISNGAKQVAQGFADGTAQTNFINTLKNSDVVNTEIKVNDVISKVAKYDKNGVLQNADELTGLLDSRKGLQNALKNTDDVADALKKADDVIDVAQVSMKPTGILSKIGSAITKPFKAAGKFITNSGVYQAFKATPIGGKIISKAGNLAKFAQRGGAIFSLAIEGGIQLFTEVVPAFKNGGFACGMKQVVKSGAYVGSSVGGWAVGAKAGSAIGAAIGSIFPGAGTVIGGAIGAAIGGMIGSTVFTGVAEKIIGKSENEIMQEQENQQQAAMIAQNSQYASYVDNQVYAKIQEEIALGIADENTEKMLAYLEQGYGATNIAQNSFGTLTATKPINATNATNYTTPNIGGIPIALDANGNYDFSISPELYTHVAGVY